MTFPSLNPSAENTDYGLSCQTLRCFPALLLICYPPPSQPRSGVFLHVSLETFETSVDNSLWGSVATCSTRRSEYTGTHAHAHAHSAHHSPCLAAGGPLNVELRSAPLEGAPCPRSTLVGGDTVNSVGGPESSLETLVSDSVESRGAVAVWTGFTAGTNRDKSRKLIRQTWFWFRLRCKRQGRDVTESRIVCASSGWSKQKWPKHIKENFLDTRQ